MVLPPRQDRDSVTPSTAVAHEKKMQDVLQFTMRRCRNPTQCNWLRFAIARAEHMRTQRPYPLLYVSQQRGQAKMPSSVRAPESLRAVQFFFQSCASSHAHGSPSASSRPVAPLASHTQPAAHRSGNPPRLSSVVRVASATRSRVSHATARSSMRNVSFMARASRGKHSSSIAKPVLTFTVTQHSACNRGIKIPCCA